MTKINAPKSDLTIGQLIELRLTRRQAMQWGGVALLAALTPTITSCSKGSDSKLGFQSVPASDLIDDVIVPEGYSARVFYRWGDPISSNVEFKMDASNSAEDQSVQAGMHHDAIQFYSLPRGTDNSDHGLLVMNHEYIDPQILHADGGWADSPSNYTLEKVKKEQNAHGISVIEVRNDKQWQIVRPSAYARRITAQTEMKLTGPVAGSDFVKTSADPNGEWVLGTFNNCSNGKTPWGSYLSCEENFHGYFQIDAPEFATEKQQQNWRRYKISDSYYGWHEHDERFNLDLHPNESNRFGWIIEFDPYDPKSVPKKRTALGRFSHENVAHKVDSNGRVAFYSADDSQFEYVYKFVCKHAWDGTQGCHHGELLNEGVLFVARFNEDGTGLWLPLIYGEKGLTNQNGFESQADVLVHARKAADVVGATPMDRPEWITVHPHTSEIFISMTNNTKRKETDAANPRGNNQFGHIITMDEKALTSTEFDWDIFALAGGSNSGSTIHGDLYANPDGMLIDGRGILWLQTDVSSSKLNSGEFAQFGNNQMLAVDPETKETRRFLTGPNGCEVTGVALTPDHRTMWVNIQHPGEVPSALAKQGVKKSPLKPNAASNWPDHHAAGRPRSATVLITKKDGGLIGS